MKRKLLSAICVVIFAIAMVAMTACTPLTHTVTFVNYDGSTLYSVVVDHNGIPSYEGETPVRAEDDEFIYEFNGWLDAEGNLCEKFPVTGADVTYTASYAKTAKYVIVFMNGSEAIEQLVLAEGSAVAYGGSTPAKAADEQYTYTFAGWSLSEGGELVEIAPVATESVTYYAVYTTTNNYRINFVNGSETLQSSLLVEGSAVAYDGATPVKAETEAYRYNFLGWSLSEGGELVEIAPVATESVTYYAVFEEIAKLFTVTFVGANGETLASSDMLIGQVPAYEGETPVKAADVYYTYTFIGWDKELAPVTAPATYVAQFSSTLRSYDVVWNIEGEETTSNFTAGHQIAYAGATPVKADDENHRYTFAGWSLTPGGELAELGLALADATYYAVFSSQNLYTVTFTDEEGKVLETQKVLEGECASFAGQIPVKESTAQYSYEYLGWIVDGVTYSFEDILPEVYEDATYALELKATLNEYEIVWVVDGVSTAKDVAYGEVPSYGADPSKEGNAEYSYTFAGWSLTAGGAVVEVSAVTGAVTYYAVFTETVNKYTVKFFNIQGIQLLEEHVVAYGEVPVFEGTLPTWDANEAMTFYPAWVDGETVYDLRYDTLPAVTGDVTYIFRNIAEVNKYTVTINYVVNSGAVSAPASKLLTLDYGTIYGEEDTTSPAISGFAPDRYWFAGYLTSNVTYTVTYNAVTTWDGSTATSFESGSGTASDPYIIKTGAQLAYLGKLGADATSAKGSVYGTGIYYKLGASIDLSNYQWTPICVRDDLSKMNWTYFDGNFDGAGYTIIMNVENTSFGYGLFQGIGGNSVIKNLTIAGQVKTGHRAGSIAYISAAGAKVDNVHNYADILTTKTSGDYWVGGFLGSSTKTTITNSANYGDVMGANLTGGIAGTAGGSIIQNSANYGNVTGGSGAKRIGGIIGQGESSAQITNSVNFGTITGGRAAVNKSDGTLDYYESSIGGIAGNANKITVTGCVNFGNVSLSIAGRCVGGITALSSGATVTDCENYGTIESVGSYNGGIAGTTQSSSKTLNSVNHGKVITSGVNTGGVTGYLGAGSYVDGCSNWATITSTAEDLGGIIGENQSNPGINAANVNYGDVSGTVRVGGVVGRQVKNSINNSENYGDVTGTGARVGGIFGDGYGASAINNCVNSGTVTGATQYFGGIGGQAANKMVLTNCVNYGDVVAGASGANNFAGIVGFVTDGSFLVLCVNYGDVSGGSTMGGIAGYLGGSAAIETASRVEGCVNYGTINGTGTVGGIVGLNNGYVTKHVAEDGTETMTVNVADVTGSSAYVGGICGNTGLSSGCVASLTEYAINYGTITAGKNDSVSSVGGINGQITNKGAIQHCENYGDVSGAGNQVGGITGYCNGTISNCYNEGDIYGGGSYVAGIVGEHSAASTTSNVINKGNVKAYTSYVGGCVGRNNGGVVTDATNHGSVTAERAASKAGTGIGGVIGSNQNSADAANLANYGDVLGYTQVGGICGYQGAGSTLDNAVNEGDVTGYGTVGQIVGTNNAADTTTNVSGTGTVTDHNP